MKIDLIFLIFWVAVFVQGLSIGRFVHNKQWLNAALLLLSFGILFYTIFVLASIVARTGGSRIWT